MSLQKEIARLYKQGKIPTEYNSSSVAESFLMLYLSNKHNITDPDERDFREKVKKYGKLTERRRKITPVPVYYQWELLLYFNKEGKLVKSNKEEYFSALYWKLFEKIQANPGKKITAKVDISFLTDDIAIQGHTELIVYDPALNTLEHMDSNNIPKQFARKDKEYFTCCEMIDEIVRDVAAILPNEPLYINNTQIYSRYQWGIQSLEAASDQLTESEKSGYCLMWAILFGDLALTFPEYSLKQIVEEMMKKAKSPLNSCKTENDYMLYVIRGYVVDISKKMDVVFVDKESMYNGCIRLVTQK
jgi:hypothetical protein